MSALLQAMECPICYDIFSEKIYVCVAGHSFCAGCHNKLTVCPLCHQQLAKVRNFALETLVAEILNQNETPCHQCPLCEMYPSSAENFSISHLQNHNKKFLICKQAFSYKHDFKNATQVIENDFIVVQVEANLFKFCAQINRENKEVSFAMQLYGNADSSYLYELDCKTKRTNKFVGKVCKVTSFDMTFTSNYINVPVTVFQKSLSNIVSIKLQCRIKPSEANISNNK